MTISGLPLHPLVVHGAVVLAPLAALIALAYALVPQWRWALRHVAVISAIAAAGSVQVAAMTGDSLAETESPVGRLVHIHEAWAGRLQVAAWVLAAAVAIAWWVIPHRSPIPDRDRSAREFGLAPVLERSVLVLVPLAALTTLGLVVLTGHAGAEAVWAAG